VVGLIEEQAAEVGGAVESYATLITVHDRSKQFETSWFDIAWFVSGDMIIEQGVSTGNFYLLKCVQDGYGYTESVEPDWDTVTPDVGDTVLDGEVIWENVGWDALVTPTVYNAPANAVGFTVFCYDQGNIFAGGYDSLLKCEITFDDDSTLSQVLTEGVAAYKLGDTDSFYMSYLSKTKNIKKITFFADGLTYANAGVSDLGGEGHIHWVTVGSKEGPPSGDRFLSLP